MGSIEIGKYADLIVVDGDPVRDFRILQEGSKFRVVMK